MAAAGVFADAVMHPLDRTHLSVNSSSEENLQFWIVTRQTYYGGLVIRPPANLDRTTFDLISGCTDYPNASLSPRQPPKWTIKSTWDQHVVLQGDAILGNPPANECSTSGGDHLFSLGKFVIAPGRYQLELKFSDNLPKSVSFPVSLTIRCCGKNSETSGIVGGFPLFFAFALIPASVIISAILVLILLVRGGLHIYRRQFQLPS